MGLIKLYDWYDDEGGELVPKRDLMSVFEQKVEWPTDVLNVKGIRNVLGRLEDEIARFFESGSNPHNPIQAERNLAFTVAHAMANKDAENEEAEERKNLASLYLIYGIESEEGKATARVDRLVANIENVVRETTGLKPPQRPGNPGPDFPKRDI